MRCPTIHEVKKLVGGNSDFFTRQKMSLKGFSLRSMRVKKTDYSLVFSFAADSKYKDVGTVHGYFAVDRLFESLNEALEYSKKIDSEKIKQLQSVIGGGSNA